jgi:hypothetical protein
MFSCYCIIQNYIRFLSTDVAGLCRSSFLHLHSGGVWFKCRPGLTVVTDLVVISPINMANGYGTGQRANVRYMVKD